ncbi:spore coat U domain-containing protein [Novosphingobium kaempferiae]|uniref:Csu type fimbrial protein n=1 Tax=Novosphingobium kaempferiae TaxID=2896849 RepID=UPI001E5EC93B|nr:spore coat U domain-containing protein [Novosphingobium kaempferiae]
MVRTHPGPALALAILCAGGIGFVRPANAETTAQFDVTATVTAGCLVDGLGGSGNAGRVGVLDFGTDSTFSTATRTATTTTGQAIRLRCTPGVSLTMSIDGGAHFANARRNLQRGTTTTARIGYTLCRDAACNQQIAVGTAVPVTVTGTNSEDVRLPIYGSLTLPGTLPPGTYTDTLTITLTW